MRDSTAEPYEPQQAAQGADRAPTCPDAPPDPRTAYQRAAAAWRAEFQAWRLAVEDVLAAERAAASGGAEGASLDPLSGADKKQRSQGPQLTLEQALWPPAPYPEAHRGQGLEAAETLAAGVPMPADRLPAEQAAEQDSTRARVLRAFRRSADQAFQRRADGLRDCGERIMWAWDELEPQATRRYKWRCRDRLCPSCARLRALRWRKRLVPLVEAAWKAGEHVRFLTVTQRILEGEGPEDAVDRMLACFRSLRRSPSWRVHVKGWARFLELTRTNLGWHAHVHMLYIGRYWRQADIVALLRVIQGDAEAGVCDIRAARHGALDELVKYPLKPVSVHTMTDTEIVRAARALAGRRLVSLGGDWADAWLQKRAKDSHRRQGSLAALVGEAHNGKLSAIRALDWWGDSNLPEEQRAKWRAAYHAEGG